MIYQLLQCKRTDIAPKWLSLEATPWINVIEHYYGEDVDPYSYDHSDNTPYYDFEFIHEGVYNLMHFPTLAVGDQQIYTLHIDCCSLVYGTDDCSLVGPVSWNNPDIGCGETGHIWTASPNTIVVKVA